jgi:zinc transporter, ZIP family
MSPAWRVLVYGAITAIATGFGALPFAFVGSVSRRAVAISNAIASGLMLGASFEITFEGTRAGAWQTFVGATAGVAFILATKRLLAGREPQLGAIGGAGARRAVLLVIVMTAHSCAEGVAVGVSFGGEATLALLITAAIAVHNVPEGLAISASLRARGASLASCAAWSVASSLPQPIMAVPAFLFVETFTALLPWGLGFAAGAMVFMVLVDLLPEAYEDAKPAVVGLLVSVSLVLMILVQQLL